MQRSIFDRKGIVDAQNQLVERKITENLSKRANDQIAIQNMRSYSGAATTTASNEQKSIGNMLLDRSLQISGMLHYCETRTLSLNQ